MLGRPIEQCSDGASGKNVKSRCRRMGQSLKMDYKAWLSRLTIAAILFMLLIDNKWLSIHRKSYANDTSKQLDPSLYDQSYLDFAADEDFDPERTKEFDHTNGSRKVILLWTWLYQSPTFEFGLGSKPFITRCPEVQSNCLTTTNHSDLQRSDAVIFALYTMGARLWGKNISTKMPKWRGHDQVYVFWGDEPPAYGTRGKLKGMEGWFNITVSYRSDSTIPLPVYKMVEGGQHNRIADVNWTSVLKEKTKKIAWVVSACKKGHSKRLEYAQALQQYIPVDIYGRCGNMSLGNCTGYRCFMKLEKSYKFYLSFENSICDDYITEKVFRPMQEVWVPIILGGGNYSDKLPAHSYINVLDFKSPKHLAKYLLHLDENDDEYLAFLTGKTKYSVERRSTHEAICEICGMLNGNSDLEYEQALDIHQWWEQDKCVEDDEVPRYLGLEENTI